VTLDARFLLEQGSFTLDVDLTLPAGCTGIVGASGSGKTSLLRCIAGLVRAQVGKLHVNGEVWQDERTFLPTQRRRLGYVFQEPSLFPHLSVRENLNFGLSRVPVGERKLSYADAVSLLGIEPLLTRRPDQLSGGERQRVAIARALLTSPQLLLMDEPLASLDLASRAQILPYFEAVQRALSIPVLYVTHAPFELARLASHVVLLQAGRLLASGALNDVITRPDLPLSHLEDAGAVLSAQVVEQNDAYHLTLLRVGSSTLSIARRQLRIGESTKLHVRARDVSLTLERPSGTSISNVLPAQVLGIFAERDPAHRLVQLQVEGSVLLARITHFSLDQLRLTPGLHVFAQVKSVALVE